MQEAWLRWVEYGLDEAKELELIRGIKREDATHEEFVEWNEQWQLKMLHWVADHLLGERHDFYNMLTAKHGTPPEEIVCVKTSMSFLEDMSPFSLDQLTSKSFEDVIVLVSSWQQTGSGYSGPNYEGLAKQFEEYVATNRESFSSKAMVLRDRPQMFVRTFISQMKEAVKAGIDVDLHMVLGLCEWVIGRPVNERTTPKQFHERLVDPNWEWTREEISRLIEAICSATVDDNPKYATSQYRERLWNVLALLCKDRADSRLIRNNPHEDFRTHDYFDHAINSARGIGIRTVFAYARWVAKQEQLMKSDTGEGSIGFNVMPEVRAELEWQIASENRSIEALSMIGANIPLIYWLDKSWLADNSDNLFRLGEINTSPSTAFGWAAWNTFLLWNDAHVEFFRLFKSQFIYAVDQAAKVALDDRTDRQPMYRLGEYLMLLCGRGELPLEDGGIVKTFLANAVPDIRRHSIGFVGRLAKGDDSIPADIIERFQHLWEVYWMGKGKSDAKEKPRSMLFGLWFASARFPDDWALDQLLEFVETAGNVEPDDWVVERLVVSSKSHLLKSVKILDKIIRADVEGWQIYGWRNDAKTILTEAIGAGGEARAIATAVIDYLGRRGYEEFGELL